MPDATKEKRIDDNLNPNVILKERLLSCCDLNPPQGSGWTDRDSALVEAGNIIADRIGRVLAEETTAASVKPRLAALLINLGNPDERFTLNEVEDAFDAAKKSDEVNHVS
jgi:hypothetical protein